LLVNSFWISFLYGSPYAAVIISRVPLSLITLVFEIIFAALLRLFILPPVKREMERF
jgi:hypothetical protein